MTAAELATLMEPVAKQLLGEPNPALSNGREWRFGTRGSLSVNLDRGIWHDHENGEGGGVLDLIRRQLHVANGDAMRWLEANGFAESPKREASFADRIVAVYRYQNEDGGAAFDVVRLRDPKDFRQRAPDGTWKVKGIRKVLYRLPELLEAPEGALVFAVEGEKDVDRLIGLGLRATTSPGGAGKWRDGFADGLGHLRVAAIPDNDEPGEKHAAAVVASFRRRSSPAAVLRLPGLPAKGDVSDWLDAGGTPQGLVELAEAALLQDGAQPGGNGPGPEAEPEPDGQDGAADIYVGRVDATGRSEPVDEVCRRLAARRLAFQYAGVASLVVEAASAVYRDPRDESKPAMMLMVVSAVPDALRRPVELVSSWQRHDERKGRLVPKPVPDWTLRQVVAERGAGLPSLLGVADHPVFHNGQLIGGHLGFHPPTNLYIHCDAIQEYRWPDPIDAARFLAESWIGRFPFRDAGDLERALLLPLTLLARRTMIRGGAPLFFITSPEARSGKSLLARCAILAITGMIPATVPFKTNPEEFNKTFDAAVLEGQTTVFFNNAPNGRGIGTAELDAYADSDEYSPRILGVSSKRTVPALAVVVCCGNNIVATGDTTTRTLEVRLERKKDEAGLVAALDFTAANRPKILSALAEVLRHPVEPMTAESRFPAWERIVARPLMNLLGARTTLRGIAEAVSGSAANLDYEDFVLCLADLADARERAALLAEDREAARWLPAGDLIADPGCNEALSRLLTRKGVEPALRANNLPRQLVPFRDQAAGGHRLRICEMPETPKKPGEKRRNRTSQHFTAEPTD